MKCKKESSSLLYRVLNKVFPFQSLSPRWDPMLAGQLNLNYLNFLFKCLSNSRNINYKKLRRIILISSPRGGSHIFSSFFHNIRSCFCLGEGYQNLDFKAINGRSFMLRGMYGINSLQDKKISEIENIFYMIHSYKDLEDQNFLEKINVEKDVIIFIFRNPLRTIISRNKAKKPRWLTQKSTECFLNEFLQNLENYKIIKNISKYKIQAIMIENFIANLDHELIKLCNFIWEDGEIKYHTRTSYDQFFRKIILCNSKPILKNEYLTSEISNEKIMGAGKFNPLLIPSLERLTNSTINLDNETEVLCKKILGQKLYDHFLYEKTEGDGIEEILPFV